MKESPAVGGRLQIAVAGAGLIGRKHIDIAFGHGILDAIIDPDARDLAERYGCLWYQAVEDYLEAHKPDGMIIATPNQLHVEHGLACIRREVPVLIEKPIADVPGAAAALVREAQRANTPILVGHHRRHNPIIKTAKAAIDADEIGRIVSVHAQFWLYKPDEYFNAAWRRSKGAGPVFINLIHDIDLLRHLCGEIARVQAVESNRVRGHDVEDSAVVILEFENGALGTVSVSDTVPAPWSWELTAAENAAYPKAHAYCYMIGGQRGALSIPDLRLWSYSGDPSWWEPIECQILPAEEADPLRVQFEHFLDVVERKVSPLVSGEEGLKSLHVIDAIKAAAATGVAQHLDHHG
ncbi:MAG: Gfo/Idh/MocA family protein [Geminicoccaceae bacterium]